MARVMRATKHGQAEQIGVTNAQALQDFGTQSGLGMVQRQLDFVDSQHGTLVLCFRMKVLFSRRSDRHGPV